MKTTTEIFQGALPEELLNDLRSLVTDAEQLIGASVSECSEESLSALRTRLEAAQKRLSALYANTKDKVVTGAKRADETIRAHPYEALALALGVGALLGVIAGRKSK